MRYIALPWPDGSRNHQNHIRVSQENFMIGDLHFVVSVRGSPEKGENEIVIVSRRGK